MGMVFTGAWAGGGGCAYVGNVLHCGDSGVSPLRVGFMGRVPKYWEGAGRISPSGDMAVDGADYTAEK